MMALELKPNYSKLCWDSEQVPAKTTCTSLLSSSESTHDDYDDDDYIAELTRQMAHCMLQDDHDKRALTSIDSSEQNQLRSWGFSGGPNSTLWSPWGSSLGSPEGPSQEPSPPATPDNNKDHAWDSSSSSSYDVVFGKLDKLNMTNERTATPVAQNPGGIGFCSNQSLAFDQISQDFQQLEPIYSVKKEKSPKKQGSSTNRGRKPKMNGHQLETYYQYLKKGGGCNGELRSAPAPAPASPFGSSNSNPWLNQQARPGMRAVFLGGSGSGSRTGSCGTGVFLPCVIGNTSQSPKKRGCSPVLIPAKVVQALKVHFDRIGDLPPPNATAFSTQNDGLKGGRRSTYAHKKRHSRMAVADMKNSEMGLPQEWTY